MRKVFDKPFRVVVRNSAGKIVQDIPAEDHAEARPIYDAIDLERGQSVALQHGVRIVFKRDYSA